MTVTKPSWNLVNTYRIIG